MRRTGFSLTVTRRVPATQAIAPKSLTQRPCGDVVYAGDGRGRNAPLSYGVSPISGRQIDDDPCSTGAITGNADSYSPRFPVTVTDANGATATNTSALPFNSAGHGDPGHSPQTSLTQELCQRGLHPVTGSGGTAPLSYGVVSRSADRVVDEHFDWARSRTPTVVRQWPTAHGDGD